MIKLIVLALLLSGCASIDKSIHVYTRGTVTITYLTASGVDIDAQELLKIPTIR